jgi:hypothetical protein
MPSVITQTQDMEDVITQTKDMEHDHEPHNQQIDYSVSTEDSCIEEMDMEEIKTWEPVDHQQGTNGKNLVQRTLYGARARLLPTKIKVRSHLRQNKRDKPEKKEKPKKKDKPKKKGTPHKKPCSRKTKLTGICEIPVKDPDFEETVKMLQQLKFNDSMELRERFFSK